MSDIHETRAADSVRPALPDGVAAQHAHLETLIRGLRVRMEGGASWDELALALDRLVVAFQAHFDDEETVMVQNAYPGLVEHQRQHQAFRRKLEALRLECDRRQSELVAVLVELLQTWLHKHEETADRDAKEYLGHEP